MAAEGSNSESLWALDCFVDGQMASVSRWNQGSYYWEMMEFQEFSRVQKEKFQDPELGNFTA